MTTEVSHTFFYSNPLSFREGLGEVKKSNQHQYLKSTW